MDGACEPESRSGGDYETRWVFATSFLEQQSFRLDRQTLEMNENPIEELEIIPVFVAKQSFTWTMMQPGQAW